jgi:hypothetical protein
MAVMRMIWYVIVAVVCFVMTIIWLASDFA